MATKIEIVNKGLAHAAQARISALDEETMVADFISTIYETEKDAALADHTWRWAREFATLNRLDDLSINDDMPQYQLPADHIRTIGLKVGGVQTPRFERTRNVLLVPGAGESSEVVLEYVTSDVDETDFPPHFVEILALRLGTRVALSIARDKELAKDLTIERENIAMPRARTSDSQQAGTKNLRRSKIASARRGARF